MQDGVHRTDTLVLGTGAFNGSTLGQAYVTFNLSGQTPNTGYPVGMYAGLGCFSATKTTLPIYGTDGTDMLLLAESSGNVCNEPTVISGLVVGGSARRQGSYTPTLRQAVVLQAARHNSCRHISSWLLVVVRLAELRLLASSLHGHRLAAVALRFVIFPQG
jgi:hypothetical protein